MAMIFQLGAINRNKNNASAGKTKITEICGIIRNHLCNYHVTARSGQRMR